MISKEMKQELLRLLSEGKLHKTLETYIKYAKKDRNASLVRKLQHLSFRLSALEKEEKEENITKELYNIRQNRIAKTLQHYIEFKDKKQQKPWIWLVLLLIAILCVAISSYFILREKAPTELPEEKCPFRLEKDYRILLYEFSRLVGDRPIRCEQFVFDEIDDLRLKNQLSLEVRIDTSTDLREKKEGFLPEDALNLGAKCAVDLSIWGNYLVEFSTDTTLINIKYASANRCSEDQYINNQYAVKVKTPRIISVLESGELTETISGIVFWALGIIETQKCNYDGAIENFKKIKADSRQRLAMKNQAIAECLKAQGKNEQAIEYYKMAAEYTNDDPIVLNNLAVSFFEAGGKGEARKLINEANQIDPRMNVIASNYEIITSLASEKPIDSTSEVAASPRATPPLEPPTKTGSLERGQQEKIERGDLLPMGSDSSPITWFPPKEVTSIDDIGDKDQIIDLPPYSRATGKPFYSPELIEISKKYRSTKFTVFTSSESSGSTEIVYGPVAFPKNWYATSNAGTDLEPGTYEYRIELKDGPLIEGEFTIE